MQQQQQADVAAAVDSDDELEDMLEMLGVTVK
jgi:hypothetical protein